MKNQVNYSTLVPHVLKYKKKPGWLLMMFLLLHTSSLVAQSLNITSIERYSPLASSSKKSNYQFNVKFSNDAFFVDQSDFTTTGSLSANSTIESVTRISNTEYNVNVSTSTTTEGSLGITVKGVGVSGSNNIINDNFQLDQQNLSNAQLSSSHEFGQSFRAGQNGALYKIVIQTNFSHSYQGTGTLYLRSGSGLGGTVLASEAVTMTSGTGEKTFWFSNPAILSAGSTYTMHFNFTSGSGSMEVSAQTNNGYAFGTIYIPNPLSSADLYFKTFIGVGPVVPLSTTAPSTNQDYHVVRFANPIVKTITRKTPLTTTALATEVVFDVEFDSSVVEVTTDDFTLNSTVGGTVDSVAFISDTEYDVYVNNMNNVAGSLELQLKGVGGIAGTNNILSKKFGDTLTVDQSHSNDYLNQNTIGQTFIAKTSTSLRHIRVFPKSGVHTFSGNATLKVFSGDELLPGATLLSTQNVYISSSTSAEGQLLEVFPAIPVSAGNTYSILIENFNGTGSHALESSSNGTYDDGHVIFSGYSSSSHSNFDLKIQIFERRVWVWSTFSYHSSNNL